MNDVPLGPPESIWVVWVAGALLVVVIALWAARLERMRAERLAEVAGHLGLVFMPGVVDSDAMGCAPLFGGAATDSVPVIDALEGFDPFGRGHSKKASHLLTGPRGEAEWQCFDYRFTTGSGKHRRTHTYGIVAARVPWVFAGLEIRPEGVLDRLGAVVGWKDIQFESEQFNRAYFVTSPDPEQAYAILHPEALEMLLQNSPRNWQFRGDMVVLAKQGVHSPEETLRAVADVEGFLGLLPAYVRQDLAKS